MVSREEIESTGFHEAEIESFEMRDNHIFLQFGNVVVDIDSNDCYRVDLDFSGISILICNDEILDTLQMEGDGSSVIHFEYTDDFAALVVDWRHYRERKNETKSYSFKFETLSFDFEKKNCSIS